MKEYDRERVFIEGKPGETPIVGLEVNVFRGGLDNDAKGEVIRRFTAIVRQARVEVDTSFSEDNSAPFCSKQKAKPQLRSRARICWVNAGCAILSPSAARVTCISCATTQKAFRCFISIITSTESKKSIHNASLMRSRLSYWTVRQISSNNLIARIGLAPLATLPITRRSKLRFSQKSHRMIEDFVCKLCSQSKRR